MPLSTTASLSKCDGVVKVLSVFKLLYLVRWMEPLHYNFA